jgi:Mor family transcriptional regulator
MPPGGPARARANAGWAKNRARDAEIVRRYGEGDRLSDLALAFGLSPTRIREIVLQRRGHQRGYGWSMTINHEL